MYDTHPSHVATVISQDKSIDKVKYILLGLAIIEASARRLTYEQDTKLLGSSALEPI